MARVSWKSAGAFLPRRLLLTIERKEVVAVACTVAPDGWTRGWPVVFHVSPAPDRLVLAVPAEAEVTADLRRDGRLSLTFLEEGDCIYTVRGKALLLSESLAAADWLVAFLVTILESVELRLPGFFVSQGVRVEKRGHTDRLTYRQVLQELRRLASEGGKKEGKEEWITSGDDPHEG